jgi:hypothetical protein
MTTGKDTPTRRRALHLIAEVGALPAALEAIREIAADGDLSIALNVLGEAAPS